MHAVDAYLISHPRLLIALLAIQICGVAGYLIFLGKTLLAVAMALAGVMLILGAIRAGKKTGAFASKRPAAGGKDE